MDQTTEVIARFIGLFEVSVTEARMRAELMAFSDAAVDEEPLGPIQGWHPDIHSKHPLEGYDPGLGLKAPPVPHAPDPPFREISPGDDPDYEIPSAVTGVDPQVQAIGGPGRAQEGVEGDIPATQPPGSVATVTIQKITASDDDVFLSGGWAEFVDPEVPEAILTAAAIEAEEAHAFEIEVQPLSTDWAEHALSVTGNEVEATELSSEAGGESEVAGASAAQSEEAGRETDGAEGEQVAGEASAQEEAAGGSDAATGSGWSVSRLEGEDASGVVVDGEAAEALPEWSEMLPHHFAQDDDEEEDSEGDGEEEAGASVSVSTAGGAGADGASDGADGAQSSGLSEAATGELPDLPGEIPLLSLDNGEEEDAEDGIEGHAFVTGGNLSVNSVEITSAWVDAAVIAVMGDVIEVEAISQVSVVIEHDALGSFAASKGGDEETGGAAADDETEDVESGDDGESGASQADDAAVSVNAAKIERVSSSGEEDEGSTGETGVAAGWVIARIEGDLISYNVVEQTTFATDSDRVEVEVSASATYVTTGENVLTNLADLGIYGFEYDLIVVGGDMIELTTIRQTAVLHDTDEVIEETGETGGGAAGAQASAQAGTAVEGQIETGSETGTETHTETQAASEARTETGGGSLTGTETETETETAEVTGGGNVQMNLAAVSSIGIDVHRQMSEAFAEAGAELAAGGGELSGIIGEAMAEAGEMLRALYVSGDFVEITEISQTNVIGDADQVAIARDALIDAAGEAASVTMGSNAQLNSAVVTDKGLDSEIHVGGKLYTDALIHQASLVDAMPDAAGIASEAVAFLAEGLIEAAERIEAVQEDARDMAREIEADVMQSMLA